MLTITKHELSKNQYAYQAYMIKEHVYSEENFRKEFLKRIFFYIILNL